MKKVMFLMMAFMSIVLTSCTYETCLLEVKNHYSKSVMVLFSHDETCNSIDEAEFAVHCKSMTAWDKQGVKVDDMYAIVYVCVDEEKDSNGSLEAFKRQMSLPLNKYAGMAVVSIDITAEGYPNIDASKL